MEITTKLKGKRLVHFVTHRDVTGVLYDNQLLRQYVDDAMVPINAFLLGFAPELIGYTSYDPDNKEGFTNDSTKQIYHTTRESHLQAIAKGEVPVEKLRYSPITKAYVSHLIELDEMMRLSKYYHDKPITLYRGTVQLIKLDMSKLNSWTTDIRRAHRFLDGSRLNTTLPKGFPYIEIEKTNLDNIIRDEREYLLPPCDFETIKSKKVESCVPYYRFDVKIRPRNLAKVFLERMKNPPATYPRAFMTDPAYEYAEAMAMLEQYVHEYVDTHTILVNDQLIPELPDPEIEFIGEQDGPENE